MNFRDDANFMNELRQIKPVLNDTGPKLDSMSIWYVNQIVELTKGAAIDAARKGQNNVSFYTITHGDGSDEYPSFWDNRPSYPQSLPMFEGTRQQREIYYQSLASSVNWAFSKDSSPKRIGTGFNVSNLNVAQNISSVALQRLNSLNFRQAKVDIKQFHYMEEYYSTGFFSQKGHIRYRESPVTFYTFFVSVSW